MRYSLRLVAVGILVCGAFFPRPARADWQGHVVEGDSAYTVRGGGARLSLLGRSAIGLGDRVELSTYLPLDAVLFPNLSLKYRFVQSEVVALALKAGAGGGLYPVAVGLTLPFGVAVGGAGLVGASYQNIDLTLSVTPAVPITVSARGGVMRAEFALRGVVGAVGAGGEGSAPIASDGHITVIDGGLEIDATLGARDAVIAELEAYRFSSTTVFEPYLAWYHAFGPRFHLTVGAFELLEVPSVRHRYAPVPYANVYWNF